MSLEDAIENLAAAISALAQTQAALPQLTQVHAPEIEPTNMAPVDPLPAPVPTPLPEPTPEPEKKKASKKKASKKKAAKKPRQASPEVAPEPEPEPSPIELDPDPSTVVTTLMSTEAVQKELRDIASQLTDTSLLFDLISALGVSQFSELEPHTYPGLIAAARKLVQ